VAAQYIRLVRFTGRWQVVGAEAAIERCEKGLPLIVAVWHGRLLMAPFSWPHSDRSHILVSAHRDGQLIARTLNFLRMGTIPGSTRRGGGMALRRLHNILHGGGVVGLTPDGPRGPRMRVTPGVIQLARLTGAPIYPIAYSAHPRFVFDSWDRFVLPFPFSRGIYLWGEPIFIARETDRADMERVRHALEETLNDLTRRADAAMGYPPMDPAPLPTPQEETAPS